MPSDRDLANQLRAFGVTLAEHTGEPIVAPEGSVRPVAAARSGRRWAFVGTAACVVALVAGLIVIDRRGEPESAGAPGAGDSSGLGPLETLRGVGVVVEATVAGHRGPVSELSGNGGVKYVGRSEVADEWTTPFGLPVLIIDDIEIVEAIGGSPNADAIANRAEQAAATGTAEVLASVGVYTKGERYQLWLSDFTDFEGFRTSLAFASDGALVEGLGAPGLESAIDGLNAYTGETTVRSLAALAREINAATAGAPQGPLMDLVFGPALAPPSAPVNTTTLGEEADVPARPATDAERAELGTDGLGLVCDVNGIGAAEWDYGPISEADERGRRPVDAFNDALVQLTDDALREGADPPPASGWTELVTSDSSSEFVLEVGGVRQAVISVSGDPALGVWRHGSADLCQSLFIPEGYIPPITEPLVTAAPPPRQPPVTTAPGATPLMVEAYPAGDQPPAVAADESVFVLVVSNQSFEDSVVGLLITIDGQVVADDEYAVDGQHAISTYHIRGLSPGVHEAAVTSSTGVDYSTTVTIPDSGPGWAYLTYWFYADDAKGRYVNLFESDEPIMID